MSQNPLTSLPLIPLSKTQLQHFSKDSLHAKLMHIEAFSDPLGESVLAVDIGGSKLEARVFEYANTRPSPIGPSFYLDGKDGLGFADFLRTIHDTVDPDIPVGISIAGGVENNVIYDLPNLPRLKEDIGSSFDNLFPGRSIRVVNDAVAGLIASIRHIHRSNPEITQVLFLINGSGIGGSLWTDNLLYKISPGHMKVADELNPNHITAPCMVRGNTYTCIENMAGGVAGIAAQWKQGNDADTSGTKLAKAMLDGDTQALALYDVSAQLLAHTTIGVGMAYDFWDTPEKVGVVYHGGVFNVPGYFERVIALARQHLSTDITAFRSSEFADNICLEGAAFLTQ